MSSNVGHGHVFPRLDGVKARCGGPALCPTCAADQARLVAHLKGIVPAEKLSAPDPVQVRELRASAHTLIAEILRSGIEVDPQFMATLHRVADNPVREGVQC